MYRLALVCVLLAVTAGTAVAQIIPDAERSRFSSAAYYNYADPADVTMLVSVWGTVRNPGLYELPQGTPLSTVLSVAGGPIVGPRENRQDRTIQIRVFRDQTGAGAPVYETTMTNEVIAAGDPVLHHGDVLTIETVLKRRFNWRDMLPVISTAASVAVVIAYYTGARR